MDEMKEVEQRRARFALLVKKEIHLTVRSGIPFWGFGVFQLAMAGWFFLVYRFFQRGIADLENFFQLVTTLFTLLLPIYAAGDWSEERKNGTWEILFSLPFKTGELVGAKLVSNIIWLGIHLLQILLLVVPLLPFGTFDLGQILGSLLGMFLYGLFALSVSQWASTLGKFPLLSYILSVCFLLFPLLAPILGGLRAIPYPIAECIRLISIPHHLDGFQRGLIILKDVSFFLVASFFFIFLTSKSLEAWRWK
jgi:ABC-2 type transport system permease protein